ncbi:MAG TPA: ABC transporter substrate-binding protein, partial [Firmicutes bacterium]|nr:ABC transporter substrate-binding protein [Bacillota bacterium]
LLKTLVPTAKTVGIIYNTSEVNSELQVELAKTAAASLGLEIITKGITSVNELSQVATSLAAEVDVIYAPTDNTVASGMPILVQVATEKNIPVIGSEASMVTNGALATVGIDYYQLGYETGLMAVEVLEGKDPSTMSIQTLENAQLVINQKTADSLGITIPDSLLQDAEWMTE